MSNHDAFGRLRQIASSNVHVPTQERCELCGAAIGDEHAHLFDKQTRRIVCGCRACSLLFGENSGGRYGAIPARVRLLAGSSFGGAEWNALGIPINMAFFCRTESTVSAFYPSPAGATQCLLDLSAWHEIAARNPELENLQPHVEALLVNRITDPPESFIVPIDRCYRLVGLIRGKWRGFSGGGDMWQSIGEFFLTLRKEAGQTERIVRC